METIRIKRNISSIIYILFDSWKSSRDPTPSLGTPVLSSKVNQEWLT